MDSRWCVLGKEKIPRDFASWKSSAGFRLRRPPHQPSAWPIEVAEHYGRAETVRVLREAMVRRGHVFGASEDELAILDVQLLPADAEVCDEAGGFTAGDDTSSE